MAKKILFTFILLLLCSSCVSRTVTAPESMSGSEKDVVISKKLVWFWDKDF